MSYAGALGSALGTEAAVGAVAENAAKDAVVDNVASNAVGNVGKSLLGANSGMTGFSGVGKNLAEGGFIESAFDSGPRSLMDIGEMGFESEAIAPLGDPMTGGVQSFTNPVGSTGIGNGLIDQIDPSGATEGFFGSLLGGAMDNAKARGNYYLQGINKLTGGTKQFTGGVSGDEEIKPKAPSGGTIQHDTSSGMAQKGNAQNFVPGAFSGGGAALSPTQARVIQPPPRRYPAPQDQGYGGYQAFQNPLRGLL